jgi:DHHC palmitoyltransferase
MTASTSSSNNSYSNISTSNSSAGTNSTRMRTFKIFGWFRFRLASSRQNLLETLVDSFHTILEYGVYLLGPILICLALGIISFLGYSFFTIMLPMILRDMAKSALWQKCAVVALHVLWVVFVLFNILYNYAYCVLTKHSGSNYNSLVREFASASNIQYPETPAQLESYRRDYHNLMALRIKRQQENNYNNHNGKSQKVSASETITSEAQQDTTSSSVITHRGLSQSNTASSVGSGSTAFSSTSPTKAMLTIGMQSSQQQLPKATTQSTTAPVTKLRPWMIMLPFEWGYCVVTQQPKPPRSHYDNVTNVLVLNLDHYCPWMFNSIGYFNYRYFLNFLIYVFLGMMYGAILSSKPFFLCKSTKYRTQLNYERALLAKGTVQIIDPYTIERVHPMMPTQDEKMYVTLAFMLCTAVGIAVSILCGFHIYLTLSSQTTIEFHANYARRQRAKAAGQKWINPYSLKSCKLNWQQVYGKSATTNILSVLNSLLPSSRERDYYPAPIPGNAVRPSAFQRIQTTEEMNEAKGLLRTSVKSGSADKRTDDMMLQTSISSEKVNTKAEV